MPCVRRHWSLGVAAAVVIAGCDDQPPAAPRDDPKPPVQASARAPAKPRAAAPRPATSAAANWRPQDRGELLLTAERRARIEAALPHVKGFLDAQQLEAELFEKNLARGKTKEAVAAFGRLAADQWVLFTGHLANPKPEGVDIAVRYTPRDANDPVGLTSTWFFVHVADVEGYDRAAYRTGDLVAVLARYDGKQRAAPGYDLVALDHWKRTRDDPL